ncbi:creatininase family protein [Planktomarina temperata]|nr:creatininase family protein [Planktomarina temperata]
MQQILDVPQRQREPDVHHYRQADDLGGRLEVAKRGAFCHGRTLNSRPARLKPVSSDRAPFSYGAASYAVAAPESSGTLHVDAAVLAPLAEQIFTGLLRIGFRNIHGVIHHQTENFSAGMPTDLAFKIGARQALFKFLERTNGEGWWGAQDMNDYYTQHQSGNDPFNWIKLHPLMDEAIIKNYIFDHAGEGETSLLMALAPEGVEIARVAENNTWYTKSAFNSSTDRGEEVTAKIIERLMQRLKS